MGKRPGKKRWLRRWLTRHRVWARSHRAGLVVLETAAGMAIVAGLALAFFLWHLSNGDISVSFLTAPIERAVNGQLSGYEVAIGDTVLEKTESGAGVSLRLKSLSLRDSVGSVIAVAPKAAVGIKLMPLLWGRLVAGSIDLIGPRLVMDYKPGGKIAIDLAGSALPAPAIVERGSNPDAPEAASSAEQSIRFIKAILSGEGGGELIGLDAIGIRQAEVVFIHERLGRRWNMSNGSFEVTRRDGGLHITAQADVGFADETVPVRARASLSGRDGGLRVAGRFDDLVPRPIGRAFETLAPLQALDMPISGDFTADLDDEGTLEGASLTALLGAGMLRPPGAEEGGYLIDEAALRFSYDAASQVIRVEKAELLTGRTRVALAGRITGPADPLEAGAPEANSWRFDLEGRDVLLGSADLKAPPLSVDRIGLTGSYDIADGMLRLDRGELAAGPAKLSLSGSVAPGETSPAIEVSGTFLPMSVATLKAIWPVFTAPGAREWVADNVRSGELTGGRFSVRFPDGLLARMEAGGTIPEEALRFEFGFKNLVFSYLGPMPPIRGAGGQGRVLGDQFTTDIDDAYVQLPSGKRLEMSSGRFRSPNVNAAAPPGEITVNIAGGVREVLEFLDQEPLGYPGQIGIAPADFGGRAEVALRVELPLLKDVTLDQVKIGAEAEMNKFSGTQVFNGRDMADGVLLISVKDNVLSADGEVLVDGRSAEIDWHFPFHESESDPARFLVTMTLDDKQREQFGLDFPNLTGPVRFRIAPGGSFGKGREGEKPTQIVADLTTATVIRTPFGWTKRAGVPGDLSFTVTDRPSGGYVLDKFALDSDGTKIRGRLVVAGDGNIEAVRFAEFNLRPGDEMSLAVDRVSKKEWRVKLEGAVFDARELIDGMMSLDEGESEEATPASGGPRIVLDAEIRRVLGHEGAYLSGAQIHLVNASGRISRLDIVGRLQERANFRAVISEADRSGGVRDLRIDADDAGAAFRFSGLYRRADGGKLQLAMRMPADPRAVSDGVLSASDFRIQDEPVLTTINEAAANRGTPQYRAQTGGIHFDRLRMPFERRPGFLRLGESIIRGPSVGATIGGTIDFANDRIALDGTFIPAYLVNNLLSRVPVLGQILVGGEDEGLVALAFAITGSTSDPRVTVNPLSVVTPGILRKIFNFGQAPVYANPSVAAPGPATGSLPRNTRPFDIR
jgi:hypothetical protein